MDSSRDSSPQYPTSHHGQHGLVCSPPPRSLSHWAAKAQESIRSRPTYPLMKQARLSLTEIGESFTTREEAFMSSLAEDIPLAGRGVRASNRGYVGFLNKLRADTFDDFMKKGQQLGIAEDPGFARSVAKYVNTATGRGELGRFEPAAVALNTVFFSPRLLT